MAQPRMVIIAGPPGAGKSSIFVFMRYIALDTVEHHIERVKRRAARGGHSASETTLRTIHASSLANLPLV